MKSLYKIIVGMMFFSATQETKTQFKGALVTGGFSLFSMVVLCIGIDVLAACLKKRSQLKEREFENKKSLK